jgi:predicted SAM-dependent methyltransferase
MKMRADFSRSVAYGGSAMHARHIFVGAVLSGTAAIAVACDQAAATPPQDAPAAATSSSGAAEEFQRNSAAIITDYLRENPVRKVQIGAGSSRLKGWLNTDIEPGGDGLAYLDATRTFPFEDGSIHYLFSEHVIEHLTYEEGKAMAAEAFRVLAPGGMMRVSTPDLTQFIKLFDPQPSEEVLDYKRGKIAWHEWPREGNPAAVILNLQMSSWGHKFMYDVETLGAILTAAGFRNLQEFEENMSNDPHLMGLEQRDTGVTVRWSHYETMSVEVEKPALSSTTR